MKILITKMIRHTGNRTPFSSLANPGSAALISGTPLLTIKESVPPKVTYTTNKQQYKYIII